MVEQLKRGTRASGVIFWASNVEGTDAAVIFVLRWVLMHVIVGLIRFLIGIVVRSFVLRGSRHCAAVCEEGFPSIE